MPKAEELIAHINDSSFYRRQLLDEYKAILNLIGDESKELKNIRKIYGQLERSTFNFFRSIDKYWKESFHEIILMQILDPHTTEIGNLEYLYKFTELLHKINNNYIYKFDGGVKVENQIGDRESGFIDILIYDDCKAIIIESKINGAEDQENQLARYYRYVKNTLKKEVLAIVYIRPMGDENKMPPLCEYSEEYKDEVEIIKKLLIPITVVDSKDQVDLCHGFLDICYDKKATAKANVFIEQYSELLKIMGENKMAMNIEKDMFKNLFADDENAAKVADIGEIWNKRRLILAAIIQDKLVEEMGFSPDGEYYCYKEIIKNKLSFTFIYCPDDKKLGEDYIFGFSFWTINKKTQEAIENVLNNIKPAHVWMEEAETIGYPFDNSLVIRKFSFNFGRSYNKILDEVFLMYKTLEKEFDAIRNDIELV
jgi:hypothetical protein